MSRKVKITVAEPSQIIRAGLVAVLRQLDNFHIEVIEVSEIDQLVNTINWRKPDILIVTPSILGQYPLQQIKKDAVNPDMKFVALQFSLTDNVFLSLYDEVISIYDSSDQIKDKVTRLINEPKLDRRYEMLSNREKEVIGYVVEGMTNKEIAEELNLSTHTIITHRRNISAKLKINSVAGLTIYAIVNKLVDLDKIKQ